MINIYSPPENALDSSLQCRSVFIFPSHKEGSYLWFCHKKINKFSRNERTMFTPENGTSIVFLPTELSNFKRVYLHGDFESTESTVTVYVTGTCAKRCRSCIGFYTSGGDGDGDADESAPGCWLRLEKNGKELFLTKFKINNELKNNDDYNVVVYYNRRIFTESGESLLNQMNKPYEKSHFQALIKKLSSERTNVPDNSLNYCPRLLSYFKCIILFLSSLSKKILPVTKYSNIAVHIDNYISGFVWIIEEQKGNVRSHIQKFDFIFAVFSDVVLGSIFLNWLTSMFSPDSFPDFFLVCVDTVVQTLRKVIHWLTGDPAGFKLNYVFSKILAAFFLYYIDIWCVFLALLKPAYKIIFQVFLVLGKAGITFQVSIISDLLILLSFHIYSICIFAARLYNIQMSALLALWRLFLGRKKNPLRGRVDSCKYSPEQLFIGTLGFTILLFLLPTTLIYYVVFTSMRILLFVLAGIGTRFQYLILSMPICSTALWLTRSPKVAGGIELTPEGIFGESNCLIFRVRPVSTSWWDTVRRFKPDFLKKPKEFNFMEFICLILTGALK